eukprot:10602712-Lingulodinium_polyedra.AAC.1
MDTRSGSVKPFTTKRGFAFCVCVCPKESTAGSSSFFQVRIHRVAMTLVFDTPGLLAAESTALLTH